MNLQSIKDAVEKGETVYWETTSYIVEMDNNGRFLVKCLMNDNFMTLETADGKLREGRYFVK